MDQPLHTLDCIQLGVGDILVGKMIQLNANEGHSTSP